MKLAAVKKVIAKALETHQSRIISWIEQVESEGKTSKVEKEFATAFEANLPHSLNLKHEQPLQIIETESYFDGRKSGRLDCFIPSDITAFEYKAVRLPRRHHNGIGGARYDIGQLVADYLRLRRAKKLNDGFVIAFLYGPSVEDAESAGKLYRTFHNQMFVDFDVALRDDQISNGSMARRAYDELGWDRAWGSGTPPKHLAAVKVRSLGAICIDCRR